MKHFPSAQARDDTVTDEEVAAMAQVLTRRYSCNAADIALHFEAEHRAVADNARAEMWVKVATWLKERTPAPTLS